MFLVKSLWKMLHGFIKKSDRFPKRELATAMRYVSDYKRRFMKNE
jgi:phage-related protein